MPFAPGRGEPFARASHRLDWTENAPILDNLSTKVRGSGRQLVLQLRISLHLRIKPHPGLASRAADSSSAHRRSPFSGLRRPPTHKTTLRDLRSLLSNVFR